MVDGMKTEGVSLWGLIDHFAHLLWAVFLLEIVGSITPFSILFFLSSDF